MARLKASVQKGCSTKGAECGWADVGLTRRRGVAEKDAEREHRRTSKPESAESAEICGASRVATVVWRVSLEEHRIEMGCPDGMG
jgi:hypothetical protein